jgi:hypothetical protein
VNTYEVKTMVQVGTHLKPKARWDKREVIVEVVPADGRYGRYTVKNTATGRITKLKRETIAEKWNVVRSGGGVKTGRFSAKAPEPKKSTHVPPPSTERERELLRIIKAKFSDFNRRQQHFYIGGGMSTSHIVLKVLEDIKQIEAFWPAEHVRKSWAGGVSYVLADDVFKKVQNAIRDTLNSLYKKSHLEKIGNSDERRWKPTYASYAGE